MANISIASRCNRACTYCFAMETLDGVSATAGFMPRETFEHALAFVVRSGIGEARLLGGEPTMHPRFGEYVDMVLERGLRLVVFSGGVMPGEALRKLESVAADRVAVLVNVIPPLEETAAARRRQAEVFHRLGPRVVLGLNIASPGTPLHFLLELIDEHRLVPSVRLGLAHPILGGANAHLLPRQYRDVGVRVAEFGFEARARGVHLEFDCGWVPCMFPDGVLDALEVPPSAVGLRCNPILDILPDGQVISCYPLANHAKERLSSDADALSLRARFTAHQERDRTFMLFKDCATCEWRARGECTGGCLAGSMRRLRGKT